MGDPGCKNDMWEEYEVLQGAQGATPGHFFRPHQGDSVNQLALIGCQEHTAGVWTDERPRKLR